MQLNSVGIQEIAKAYSDNGRFLGGDKVTNDNGAFFGSIQHTNAGTDIGYILLYNPVSSGVILMLDKTITQVKTTTEHIFRRYNNTLSNQAGGWYSRKMPRTSGQGEIWYGDNAASLGDDLWRIEVQANELLVIEFDEPVQLGEGEGYMLRSNATTTEHTAAFFGREVAS